MDAAIVDKLKKSLDELEARHGVARKTLIDCFNSNVDLNAALQIEKDKYKSLESLIASKQSIIDELNKQVVELTEKLNCAQSIAVTGTLELS